MSSGEAAENELSSGRVRERTEREREQRDGGNKMVRRLKEMMF